MADLVLFTSLYLAVGAALGQLHLLACASCAAKFGTFGHHAKYIAASALVGLPMTLWGYVAYTFSECDED